MRFVFTVFLTFLTLTIWCSIFSPAFSQVVRANGVKVTTEWPINDDFSDLNPLLSSVRTAQIVHLRGDGGENGDELLHRARRRLILFLHEFSNFNVLVLPVGIFEGAWTNTQLRADSAVSIAANTLYRVWRESEAFLDLLNYCQQTSKEKPSLEIIGGLCRYHAVGKVLYAPHLIHFFDAVQVNLLSSSYKKQIEQYLAGPSRLSRSSKEIRLGALKLTESLLQHFADVRKQLEAFHGDHLVELEEQFLKNMHTFVELEQLRAGDIQEDPSFIEREKKQNLDWFLKQRFPGGKIIYWEGRGADVASLPTNRQVF